MFDKWSKKRMSNGAIDMALISSVDMPLIHIVDDFFPCGVNESSPLQIIDYWQINTQYAFAMTAQQQGEDFISMQGVYLLQDNVPTWELQYCLKNHDLIDSYALPWMKRPIQMEHSPVQWWFANRPHEARIFCSRLQRVMNPVQWRLAGLHENNLSSEYENILALIQRNHAFKRSESPLLTQLHF